MASRLPRPVPTDGFVTPTSTTQAETETVLLNHIPDKSRPETLPVLQKNAHMQYLVRNLVQGFPARYVSQDASQPWLLFWTLQGFSILQVGLDPGNKQRAIDKIMTWQHPGGGFGGGPGQAAHLLPTYAAVCSLAIVGRSGPGGGWDQIDREKLYNFFMSLKQPDGSFLVTHHAEVDVRGIYCLLVTATLLDLLTPELVDGTAEFIASCQTYEGGFSSSSQPYYSLDSVLLSSPRPPLGEAHGGYTFCSLASWILLQPFVNAESDISKRPEINLKNLLRWLVQVQGTEIELGGFKGRTNKLVDGCYSWWCGGSFALLEGLGLGGSQNTRSRDDTSPDSSAGTEECWDDIDDSLFNRKALQEYILYAGQHPAGGLRDKPPKNADAYHTLYCISGLSSAQHHVFPSSSRQTEILGTWVAASDPTVTNPLRKHIFSDSLSWIEEEGGSVIVGGKDNRVNATHPVFNLTMTHCEGLMAYFYKQKVPPRILKSTSS
ncbi:terpenoid cyclases/protein prenyltransferase alpha-alpha toroid [Collybia nuda]|uniref:Protein farnesyltransferase subunit beta n=1 Tax=Collybia nuda TaxID=64659 RepID=A0A9P6CFM5_9AGAR|nr:terpenoid cyclases/protein prenyltransferase alpha-alpha toroid [Collybia nuda]